MRHAPGNAFHVISLRWIFGNGMKKDGMQALLRHCMASSPFKISKQANKLGVRLAEPENVLFYDSSIMDPIPPHRLRAHSSSPSRLKPDRQCDPTSQRGPQPRSPLRSSCTDHASSAIVPRLRQGHPLAPAKPLHRHVPHRHR